MSRYIAVVKLGRGTTFRKYSNIVKTMHIRPEIYIVEYEHNTVCRESVMFDF